MFFFVFLNTPQTTADQLFLSVSRSYLHGGAGGAKASKLCKKRLKHDFLKETFSFGKTVSTLKIK